MVKIPYDGKKSYQVPRSKLWSRKEELEIPTQYGVSIHRLYEQVRAKILTKKIFLECFGSVIGVKQDAHYPLPYLGYTLTN